MYVAVEGERLRTQFADAPRVSLNALSGSTDAVIEFDSSLIEPDGENWVTDVRFVHVIDFRFTDFELGLKEQMANPDDLENRLIEITDSDILRAFARAGSLSRTAIPVLAEKDLRHYRISFDDHGIYDVVCTGIEITERRGG